MVDAGQVADETLRAQSVIALGLFATNPVCEALPAVAHPGRLRVAHQGRELRAAHGAQPWLSGTNVVAVGSASEAGLGAATDRLVELIRAAEEALWARSSRSTTRRAGKPDAAAVAAAEKRIDEEPSSRTMGAIAAGYADDYWLTGDPAWARLFLRAMRRLDGLYAAEGAADDVRTCQQIFQQLDRIEEGPAFSEAERRELTDIFYRFAGLMTSPSSVPTSTEPHGNNWNATGAAFAACALALLPDLERASASGEPGCLLRSEHAGVEGE